ncbi:hypothetical protein ACFFSW_00035 [Saccharothrix longispora]|uniref:Terpene synthase n=1 Tax=Saccharothrix longispora TaxID=33920 RepID=A0ABU1PUP1_9PSEU|nr:hypothetical protein [Saccharothrix longispora]MDR6594370.1 hypothetical protein [Saccharothrix longispora]
MTGDRASTTGTYPSFRLPLFPRFAPALRRPDLDHLEARCRTWLSRALRDAYSDDPAGFQRFLDQRTSLWSLLTYPTSRPDRVEVVCRWIDVLFSLDDAFAHASPRRTRDLGLHELPAVLDGATATTRTPHLRALTTLWRQLRADMPTPLRERFARTTADFFRACRTEREWQDARTAIGPSAYVRTRRKSIGECCFPLLEHGLGLDLTGDLAVRPELRELNALVARHWIGVNDIFSYRKELHGGDTMNEIALNPFGDLQTAVDRVAATVREVEDRFLVLRGQLLTGAVGTSPGVRQYAEALGWMLAGNLEWSYITTRYHGAGHVWDGCRDAVVTLTPRRTIFATAPTTPPGPDDTHRCDPHTTG